MPLVALNDRDRLWLRDLAKRAAQVQHVIEGHWPARFGGPIRLREFEELLLISNIRDVHIRNGRLFFVDKVWNRTGSSSSAVTSDSWVSGDSPPKQLPPLKRAEALSLLEGRIRRRHLLSGVTIVLCRKCGALPLEKQVVVLPCKHFYCEDCYNHLIWNKREVPECLGCGSTFVETRAQVLSRRSEVSKDWLTAAGEIHDMIEHLKVRCPFKRSRKGCPWVGEVCDAVTHVMKCLDAAQEKKQPPRLTNDSDEESPSEDSGQRGSRLRVSAQMEKRVNALFKAAGIRYEPPKKRQVTDVKVTTETTKMKLEDPVKIVDNDLLGLTSSEAPPQKYAGVGRSLSVDFGSHGYTDLMTLPQLGSWEVTLSFSAQRHCPPNLPLLPYAWLDVRVGDTVIVHAHPANNVWGFALGMREDRPDLKGWFPWGCILPKSWSLDQFVEKLEELKFTVPVQQLKETPPPLPCLPDITTAPGPPDHRTLNSSSSEEGEWHPMPPNRTVINISDSDD